MSNDKGFTVIELVISMFLIGLILMIVIKVPTNMLLRHKSQQDLYRNASTIQILDLSIRRDIKLSKNISSLGNVLKVGDVSYTFNEKNVEIKDGDEDLMIKNKNIKHSLSENLLTITAGEHGEYQMKYNIKDSFNK